MHGNSGAAARLARAIAGVIGVSQRRPRAVIAAILLITLALAPGVAQFSFHNRFTDWVPDANDDKAAFDRAVERVPGLINYEIVWLELDPEKTTVANFTHPTALRAQVEFAEYVRARVPQATGFNGPAHWVMLANYARHDGDPAHYRLPDNALEMELARRAAWNASRDSIVHFTARDFTGGAVGFPIDAEPLTPESNAAGNALREAVAAYRAEENLTHDVFKDAYLAPVGVASASGQMDDIARSEVPRLAPVALAVIAVAMWLAVRRALAVAAALATVGLSMVWVLGAAGWTGQQLNLMNLAIIPLILGNGIDYAVHILHGSSAQEQGEEAAARRLARGVGLPIAFVTATTVLGLAAMVWSGSRYLIELGVWASTAMVVTAILSLTFLPAAQALIPGAAVRPRRMDALGAFAAWAARHRRGLAAVLVLVSAGAAWSAASGEYTVALLEASLPADDPAVQAKTRFEAQTHGGDVAYVIHEGDVLSPAAIAHANRVTDALVARGVVTDAAAVYDLPLLLGAYDAVENDRGGALTHALGLQDGRRGAPTGDGARVAVRDMYASPVWGSTVRTLVDPAGGHAVQYVLPVDTGDSLEEAARHREAVEAAVAAAGAPPPGVDVHVYGFKVMAHDFLQFSITWLWTLFAITFGATCLLVWLLLRDLRMVAAVAGPMVLSGVWWLGLLPLFGISVTIYLLIAVLFITSIGSDYAAYLAWRARETGSMPEAFATTGRAVLFAAVTDAGAFLVFTQVPVVSAAEMMLAAFLAIACIFAATALWLPLFPVVRPRAPSRAPPPAPPRSQPRARPRPHDAPAPAPLSGRRTRKG